MIQDYFRAQVVGRCDYPCMATQDAIDVLAAEYGRGRKNLLSVLLGISRADLLNLVMGAWAHAPLKLATGKSRDEWLDLLN